ncbi:hypothetical protein CONCODRAFT_10691 [Conidiobolus coronatus NRRL 28638]|uniref:Uncharacterized protein n=1 Tax=Conidiobolus coronatus (strain ATCC 28846 / CBS 209.66 / NRRL 28638) TaxID=796925 RepID=A0A137NX99_CONC2|nr:hypothetical protein CONCODRAFT_10691 [Conidiobolus coronatus NRRL 28638]|eukprot:KXN67284.1 hypothetical protein CONCODRAFT_10691 [Conidiobolus coronatus NRRL 28638]
MTNECTLGTINDINYRQRTIKLKLHSNSLIINLKYDNYENLIKLLTFDDELIITNLQNHNDIYYFSSNSLVVKLDLELNELKFNFGLINDKMFDKWKLGYITEFNNKQLTLRFNDTSTTITHSLPNHDDFIPGQLILVETTTQKSQKTLKAYFNITKSKLILNSNFIFNQFKDNLNHFNKFKQLDWFGNCYLIKFFAIKLEEGFCQSELGWINALHRRCGNQLTKHYNCPICQVTVKEAENIELNYNIGVQIGDGSHSLNCKINQQVLVTTFNLPSLTEEDPFKLNSIDIGGMVKELNLLQSKTIRLSLTKLIESTDIGVAFDLKAIINSAVFLNELSLVGELNQMLIEHLNK